jgi:hypothetical protein
VSLVKTADKASVRAGDVVTYTFTVTNTGNLPLSDLVLTETAFTGHGPLDWSALACRIGGTSVDLDLVELGPGATVVCTLPYTVTVEDQKEGAISNTAVVSGQPVGEFLRVVSESSSAQTTVIAVDKAQTGGFADSESSSLASMAAALLVCAGFGVVITLRRRLYG